MLKVGFTGTQKGMSNEQVLQIHMLLGDLKSRGATHANHGMCEGSDAQFHDMAKALRYYVVGFPGVDVGGRIRQRAPVVCDEVLPVKFFLDRNRDIVMASSVLLATPKSKTEQFRGSGTWATIRYARKVKLPLCVVWEDGTGFVEHVKGATTLDEFRSGLLEKLGE